MALGYLVAAASGNVSVKHDLFRATPADVDGEDGEEEEEVRLFPGPPFGSRFGMSKHRFFLVLRFMRFGSKSKGDKWSLVRPIVDTCNQARVDGFQPGWQICVDETMSAWRGRDGKVAADGMQHVTKIMRKPKGVGGEFGNSADVATGVCLRLGLAEDPRSCRLLSYVVPRSCRLLIPGHVCLIYPLYTARGPAQLFAVGAMHAALQPTPSPLCGLASWSLPWLAAWLAK